MEINKRKKIVLLISRTHKDGTTITTGECFHHGEARQRPARARARASERRSKPEDRGGIRRGREREREGSGRGGKEGGGLDKPRDIVGGRGPLRSTLVASVPRSPPDGNWNGNWERRTFLSPPSSPKSPPVPVWSVLGTVRLPATTARPR